MWQRLGRHAAERHPWPLPERYIVADNDEARVALEDAEAEEAVGETDAEETEGQEATEGASPEPEDQETSDDSSDSGEAATGESAAEQIAALAARIDGIAGEISEIRRWFKMSTVDSAEEGEGPDDLSFEALADFIIGEN